MAEWQLPKLYMAVRFRSPAFKKIAFVDNLKARFLVVIFTFAFLVLTFYGCATKGYIKTDFPVAENGFYHKIKKGETLWGISNIYGVELNEIARVNRIADAAMIEKGRIILIPFTGIRKTAPQTAISEEFIWPIKGRIITAFGAAQNNMINKGIDIQPYKNTNIVAARSGKVVFLDESFGGFGKTIIIDHQDGLSSIYTRNSEVFVKIGQQLQRGTVIAKVGSAGRDKNTYLHFEIRRGYLPQNPAFYLSQS